MTEHFTKATETASAWCKKCNRVTTHRVDGGRLGPCQEHFVIPKAVIPKLDMPKQENLFADEKNEKAS